MSSFLPCDLCMISNACRLLCEDLEEEDIIGTVSYLADFVGKSIWQMLRFYILAFVTFPYFIFR